MNNDLLFFNGINGATGDYLLPPMTVSELSQIARGETFDPDHLNELKYRYRLTTTEHLGVKEGIDPKELAQAGWGVIFAYNADPGIKEALAPLLQLRHTQAAAKKESYYQEYIGDKAYRPAETKSAFLARHGAGPGPADPDKVPYYLLIVGDPNAIPFSFQYQLDVQYAVGRIHFDTLDEYAQYAASVAAAETGKVALPRRAAFFGVQNPDDGATNLSAEHLVRPLADWLQKDHPDWQVQTILKEDATKQRLGQLLCGNDPPAFLFTASHGMSFPKDDKRQLQNQGALLCQNWNGPKQARGPISPDWYFSGDDLAGDAHILGLIAFHFACYGAGTPLLDDFAHQAFKQREAIAPQAFIANLPRRLLAHPQGGALAAIGHVERAWGYSFMWDRAGDQLTVFESTLKRLVEGHPIGSALEFFNERYAELSSDLSAELEDVQYGKKPDDYALAGMWTANNDARSYIIVGDPAVRLPISGTAAAPVRPTIQVTTRQTRQANITAGSAKFETGVQPAAPVDYGILDSDNVRQAREKLGTALQQFTEKLGQVLEQAVDNATSLEVRTYVSDRLDEVKYEKGAFTGAVKLRALTRVNLDGDAVVCVPEQAGEIDEALWTIHADMVKRALANRAEMMQAAVSAASNLLKSLQGS